VPFERFEKLASEKRERILDTAAQEFAAHGFEHASVNRILERAQMSKGAAYYYFADKADLFGAAVLYASKRIHLADLAVDLAALTAQNFWQTFAELHRQPLLRSFEQPWLFVVIRAAGQLSPEQLGREPLASLARQIVSLAMKMVERGQVLGVIRSDLPVELLFAWLRGLDQASDQWLTERWGQLDHAAIARVSDQTVEAMRRALTPEAGDPSPGKEVE
jgi:AcrR family transcriptional regulator